MDPKDTRMIPASAFLTKLSISAGNGAAAELPAPARKW